MKMRIALLVSECTIVQSVVVSPQLEELLVRALLDGASLVEYDDSLRRLNGLESMCDEQ